MPFYGIPILFKASLRVPYSFSGLFEGSLFFLKAFLRAPHPFLKAVLRVPYTCFSAFIKAPYSF